MMTNREDDIRRARQMSRLHAHNLSKVKREPQADTTFELDPRQEVQPYIFTGINTDGYACYDEA